MTCKTYNGADICEKAFYKVLKTLPYILYSVLHCNLFKFCFLFGIILRSSFEI